MKPGLHQQISQTRRHLGQLRTLAADSDASPRTKHDANSEAARQQRNLGILSDSVRTGEEVASGIEAMLEKLQTMPSQSAELTLAIRDLETAGFRLRQHLGARTE